jgi:hypothetical protein
MYKALFTLMLLSMFIVMPHVSIAEITEEDIGGLWLFDEGSGKTVSDSSGNGNDGEIVGELEWVDGKFGKALQYPGESMNLVMLPNSDSLNPTSGITIMAWGWLVEGTGNNRRFLQKSTAGSDNQYRLLLEWGNFRFDPGPGVSPQALDTPVFAEEEWHHVAGVYDGSESAIYIDGEKVASQAASGEMIPSDGPIFLGAKWNDPGHPGDYWKGMIDELAVFKRGLTADEIKQAMNGLGNIFAAALYAEGKLATTWGELKR